MKKNTLFAFPVFLFILFAPSAFTRISAQSFSSEVIGTAGTFAQSSSGSMSWIIGEVITDSYFSADNFFTQGFHQPDNPFAIPVINNSDWNISIYPNPTIDNAVIDFSASSGDCLLEIFDMQGQLLRKELISESFSGHKKVAISFFEFANGIYLLNITDKKSNTKNSYKISKSE